MTETMYIAKARESIKSGFVSIQKKGFMDCENCPKQATPLCNTGCSWEDIDPENPGLDIDYYSCFLFKNGKHIPTPIVFDAVYPFWDHCFGPDENTLQIRVMRYWLEKTGLINDQNFILAVNWAMDHYIDYNYNNTPVPEYNRVKLSEYFERYAEPEKQNRLMLRQEAYFLCHDKIKEFIEEHDKSENWKVIFESLASPADFMARLVYDNYDEEDWLIVASGEIKMHTNYQEGGQNEGMESKTKN
jgi:hypothetical protein